MIAVTSAMIVPSLDLSGASLDDEAEKLQSTLRFASQEAQLSGEPLRWVATKHSWYFEVLTQDKATHNQDYLPLNQSQAYIEPSYRWEAYEEQPLQTYQLPEPLFIQAVEQAIDVDLAVEVSSSGQRQGESEKKEPTLGQVLFLPDGTTSLSDIKFASEQEGIATMTLRVRPGPAGIRLQKEGEN